MMNFAKTTALTPTIPEENFLLIPFLIIGAIIPCPK
jgi:hypothetical protein